MSDEENIRPYNAAENNKPCVLIAGQMNGGHITNADLIPDCGRDFAEDLIYSRAWDTSKGVQSEFHVGEFHVGDKDSQKRFSLALSSS